MYEISFSRYHVKKRYDKIKYSGSFIKKFNSLSELAKFLYSNRHCIAIEDKSSLSRKEQEYLRIKYVACCENKSKNCNYFGN